MINQKKTMNLLKNNLDNKKKKDMYDKLVRRIKKNNDLKNMVKSFIDQSKKDTQDNNNPNKKDKEELTIISQNLANDLFDKIKFWNKVK